MFILAANNFNAYSLYPFSAKDLSIRNLSDRLFDLTYLTKLYPDTGKIQAFGKYYTKSQGIHNIFLSVILVFNFFFIISCIFYIKELRILF